MTFQKKDIFFFFAIFAICLAFFAVYYFSDKAGDTVYIYYNSELYTAVPLDKDTQININDTNTVIISDSCVYMSEANCPDKLCIKQGKIYDSGRSIICLPNKISVSVDVKSDVDAISQ